MATKRTDKYADYRYKIITPEELREAKWLIEEGDYKDMNDYIDSQTRIHKSIMKHEDSEKKKRALEKRKKIVAVKRSKAA